MTLPCSCDTIAVPIVRRSHFPSQDVAVHVRILLRITCPSEFPRHLHSSIPDGGHAPSHVGFSRMGLEVAWFHVVERRDVDGHVRMSCAKDMWQRCLEFLFQASVGTATALCIATAVAHCSPSHRPRQGGRNTIPTQSRTTPPRSVRLRVSGRPAPPVGWGGSGRDTNPRAHVSWDTCVRGGLRGGERRPAALGSSTVGANQSDRSMGRKQRVPTCAVHGERRGLWRWFLRTKAEKAWMWRRGAMRGGWTVGDWLPRPSVL